MLSLWKQFIIILSNNNLNPTFTTKAAKRTSLYNIHITKNISHTSVYSLYSLESVSPTAEG